MEGRQIQSLLEIREACGVVMVALLVATLELLVLLSVDSKQ